MICDHRLTSHYYYWKLLQLLAHSSIYLIRRHIFDLHFLQPLYFSPLWKTIQKKKKKIVTNFLCEKV